MGGARAQGEGSGERLAAIRAGAASDPCAAHPHYPESDARFLLAQLTAAQARATYAESQVVDATQALAAALERGEAMREAIDDAVKWFKSCAGVLPSGGFAQMTALRRALATPAKETPDDV